MALEVKQTLSSPSRGVSLGYILRAKKGRPSWCIGSHVQMFQRPRSVMWHPVIHDPRLKRIESVVGLIWMMSRFGDAGWCCFRAAVGRTRQTGIYWRLNKHTHTHTHHYLPPIVALIFIKQIDNETTLTCKSSISSKDLRFTTCYYHTSKTQWKKTICSDANLLHLCHPLSVWPSNLIIWHQ